MTATTAGERLKGLRTLTGLTQKEFAAALGIDYDRLKNIEQHKQRMTDDVFAKACKQFPYFSRYLTFDGDVDFDEMKTDDRKLAKRMVFNIKKNNIPTGYNLEKRLPPIPHA
jgi:transcriptional regulator with XRE-family HTH domain